jgi:hypothetical protein
MLLMPLGDHDGGRAGENFEDSAHAPALKRFSTRGGRVGWIAPNSCNINRSFKRFFNALA